MLLHYLAKRETRQSHFSLKCRVAPTGVKFGVEEGTYPLLHAKLHPIGVTIRVYIGPQKLKFLLRFNQNVEYKRRRIPCAIFIKFADLLARFWMR